MLLLVVQSTNLLTNYVEYVGLSPRGLSAIVNNALMVEKPSGCAISPHFS